MSAKPHIEALETVRCILSDIAREWKSDDFIRTVVWTALLGLSKYADATGNTDLLFATRNAENDVEEIVRKARGI